MEFFEDLRRDNRDRFSESFDLLRFIVSLEPTDAREDTDGIKILRGLFYVSLYSSLERSVNETVSQVIEKINENTYLVRELERNFYVLALHREFQAVENKSNRKFMQSRFQLLDTQNSEEMANVDFGCVSPFLQNIWPDTISFVYKCFGLYGDPTIDSDHNLALREVTDVRNRVAHGRESAKSVGSAKRSDTLKTRYNQIEDLAESLLRAFENRHQTGWKRT